MFIEHLIRGTQKHGRRWTWMRANREWKCCERMKCEYEYSMRQSEWKIKKRHIQMLYQNKINWNWYPTIQHFYHMIINGNKINELSWNEQIKYLSTASIKSRLHCIHSIVGLLLFPSASLHLCECVCLECMMCCRRWRCYSCLFLFLSLTLIFYKSWYINGSI